jgi:predicted HicB family RNase H-like nuclease
MATKAKKAAADTFESRAAKFLQIAREAFATAETWEDMWNAVYGIGTPFEKLFPTQAEREAFARTDEARQINEMLENLQCKGTPPGRQARFVLRLPRSMFEALKAEAQAEGVSINQLCVAKLATKLRTNLFVKC